MNVLIHYAADDLPSGETRALFSDLLPEQVECIAHAKDDPERATELVKIVVRECRTGPARERLLALSRIAGFEVLA